MSLDDYIFIDARGTEASRELDQLVKKYPLRATRLVDWIEDSMVNAASREECVTNGQVQIYMVPPRFVLSNLPDAAALIRIDNDRKEIRLVKVVELYGGLNESADWQNLLTIAAAASKG